MRLRFVDTSLFGRGIEQHVLALALAMRARGHEVMGLWGAGGRVARGADAAGLAYATSRFRNALDPRGWWGTVRALRRFRPHWVFGSSGHACSPGSMTSRPVYPGLDVLAVPSQWREPFGRVAVEAQACGVPVLSSRVGGLPETGAALLEPADTDAWVEARCELAGLDAAEREARKPRRRRVGAALRFPRHRRRGSSSCSRLRIPEEGRTRCPRGSSMDATLRWRARWLDTKRGCLLKQASGKLGPTLRTNSTVCVRRLKRRHPSSGGANHFRTPDGSPTRIPLTRTSLVMRQGARSIFGEGNLGLVFEDISSGQACSATQPCKPLLLAQCLYRAEATD